MHSSTWLKRMCLKSIRLKTLPHTVSLKMWIVIKDKIATPLHHYTNMTMDWSVWYYYQITCSNINSRKALWPIGLCYVIGYVVALIKHTLYQLCKQLIYINIKCNVSLILSPYSNSLFYLINFKILNCKKKHKYQ